MVQDGTETQNLLTVNACRDTDRNPTMDSQHRAKLPSPATGYILCHVISLAVSGSRQTLCLAWVVKDYSHNYYLTTTVAATLSALPLPE